MQANRRLLKSLGKGALSLLLAAALLCAATPAQATVLTDTFGAGDSFDSSNSWYVGCLYFPIFGCISRMDRAMPFSFTGLASTTYYVTSVTVALEQATVDPQVVVNLSSDNGGVPGTVLESHVVTAVTPPAAITVNFTGTVQLSENTTYWLWLSCPSGSVAQTWQKNDQGITGTVADRDLLITTTWTAWGPETLAAFRVEGSSTAAPTVVDLNAGDENTLVYGKTANDQMTHDGALLTGDLNGDGTPDLIIGAPYADGPSNGRANAGEVYVYYGDWTLTGILDIAGTSGYTPDIVVYGAAAGDNLSLGNAIAVGDVNADGVDDLIVGAPNVTGPGARTACGAAYVVYGTKQPVYLFTDPARSPIAVDLNAGDQDVTIYGATASDHLTIDGALKTADVNGDTVKDIVLGAKDADPNGASSGEAYVIFGSSTLAASSPYDLNTGGTADVTILGAAAGDELTRDGAIAFGDINKSGVTDLILGASLASTNGASAGEAYVIYGSGSIASSYDLSTGAEDVTILGAAAGDLLTQGDAIVTGDVNGDGVDDLVLGASGASAGAAYIIYGSAAPSGTYDLSTGAEDVTIVGGTAGDALTLDGALALGDVNNDGIDDILLGAPNAQGPNTRAASGAAYVIYGSGSLSASYTMGTNEDVLIEGAVAGDLLTNNGAVLLADVNGDGLSDICLGATDADPNGASSGEAFIIHGSAALNASYDLGSGQMNAVVYGATAGDKLTSGGALCAADINEDGVADLILGAEFASGPADARSSCGEAYLWFGGGAPLTAVTKRTDYAGNPLGKDYTPVRVKVDFTAGTTASTTQVDLTRSRAGVNMDLMHTADVVWKVTTNRTGPAATVTFHYLPSEVTGLREDWLTVYYASSIAGTWSADLSSVVDTEANTVTITSAPLGYYYALYERDPNIRCFVESVMENPWLKKLLP